jgi:anaerobic selenocysteine-containing dehydrogenase
VELDAQDAKELGVAEGDCVRVHNHRATLELPVRISGRLRPGVVAVPWGWWGHQHGDGKVANALTSDTLTDWGGGVAFYDATVAITPIA